MHTNEYISKEVI